MIGVAASCRTSASSNEPCVFPGSSESVLTSDVPLAGDSSFSGSVVDAAMSPVQGAQVILEPGRYGTSADRSGAFQFEGVPRGRYLLRVLRIGFYEAMDSVTYSEFGVRVVAVLVRQSFGHRVCVRAARYPYSRP